MNQFGLAYDMFTMHAQKPSVPRDTLKKDFSYDVPQQLLKTCKTIEEVYTHLSNLNLHVLNGSNTRNGGMLLFIDKHGKYLVLESNHITLGQNNQLVLANFSYADSAQAQPINIERYRKGVSFLQNAVDTSLSFCTRLSDTMAVCRSKAGDGILYTAIYDLNEGKIFLYFFHDFQQPVIFDLEQETKQGQHRYYMQELFPENRHYTEFLNYQTPQNNRAVLLLLGGLMGLCILTGIYFLFIYLKSKNLNTQMRSAWRFLAISWSLISLFLFFFIFYLIVNPALIYFQAPYFAGKLHPLTFLAYLPTLLLLFIPWSLYYFMQALKFSLNHQPWLWMGGLYHLIMVIFIIVCYFYDLFIF